MKIATYFKKSTLIIGLFCFLTNSGQAQTVVYDLFLGDLINQTNTCSTVPNEAMYTQYDTAPWGFQWTSTGTATPGSVTIEFYRGIDCAASWSVSGESLPITLNGGFETNYITTSDIGNCDCQAPTPQVITFSGTPANYIFGGLNVISIPKASDFNNEMGFKVNPAWGGAYARVTVDYCTPLTTSVSATTLCDGDLLTLSATGSGTITWDNGVVDGVPFVPATTGVTTYTATSTDLNECTFSVDVLNNPLPLVTSIFTDSTLCLGDSLFLMATGNADTYVWGSGTANGDFYTPIASITETVTGEFTATGCQNVVVVNITVNDVVITGTGSDELFGNDGGVDITPSGGSVPYVFDWDNDGTGDFDDTEDLTGLIAGTYIVVVQDAIGCTDSATYTIGSQVGIDENETFFTIYPNPTSDNLTIETIGVFTFAVVDISGKEIFSGNGTDKKIISLENLNSGAYIIEVTVDGTTAIKQIIKN